MSTILEVTIKLARENPEFRQALRAELLGGVRAKQAARTFHDQAMLDDVEAELLRLVRKERIRGVKVKTPTGLWNEIQLTDMENGWHYIVRLMKATNNPRMLTIQFRMEPLPGSSGEKVTLKSSTKLGRSPRETAIKLWGILKDQTPQREF